MAELGTGVNKFQVNVAGDNGKIAFSTDAPTGVGFAESTHHFAKTADDMGVFVYTNDVTSIKIWQKINGSWVDCGSTGGQTGFPWHGSFAWRDGATHMHVQLDGPNNANETIRIIKIEGNMFASFDGTTANSVLLLNDSVVEDTDDDGDIEVTSGVGYNVVPVGQDQSWIGGTSQSFYVTSEIDLGIFIKNDTEVISFTNSWDGTKDLVTFDLAETPARGDKFVFYFREPQTYSGNVSDGAISGATVTDVATGETVTTDSNGDFTFTNRPAGEIEAEGGVDVVTGDAYVGKMKGHSKYTIISPLSTAAVEVAADQGISFDQAVDDILDNSAELFGIDFPKKDKLELLNKRFVDEAAKGNSKAVRGSALIAMIDAAAEIVGESLTNMSDSVAGDLATDAVDGKSQAYKGIARLVSDAKALTDTEREELGRPLAVDTQRVSNAVAIRKGAATAEITLKNERGNKYTAEITNLLFNRADDMAEALSSKYDENYAITRIQSIAKTAKNEDKTALEGFKGDGDSLAIAEVDNSKLNQIGDVPNVVFEVVRSVIIMDDEGDTTPADLTFTYGDVSKIGTPSDKSAFFSYYKELETGTQLYYGVQLADNAELDLRNISNHFSFTVAEKEEAFTRAKTMTFVKDGFTYTVNYNGIVVLKEEIKTAKTIHPLEGYTYVLSSVGLGSTSLDREAELGIESATSKTTVESINTGGFVETIEEPTRADYAKEVFGNLQYKLTWNSEEGLFSALDGKGGSVTVSWNGQAWILGSTLDENSYEGADFIDQPKSDGVIYETEFEEVNMLFSAIDTATWDKVDAGNADPGGDSETNYGNIIALHGGGGNGADFETQVFEALGGNATVIAPNGGFEIPNTDPLQVIKGSSYLWLPEVNKESGMVTTDPKIADVSVDVINNAIRTMEDQSGDITLLGYSDGAAMIIAFLGRANDLGYDISRIKRVVFIKGYVEGERHQGLNFADAKYVPFTGISSYIIAGGADVDFYDTTLAAQSYFEPSTLSETKGEHEFEISGLEAWLQLELANGGGADPVNNKLTTWEGAKIYEAGEMRDTWSESSRYELTLNTFGEHVQLGQIYDFIMKVQDLAVLDRYQVYSGDMDNVYSTESKVESTIPITWEGSQARFSIGETQYMITHPDTLSGDGSGEEPATGHLFTSGGLYSVEYSNSTGGTASWPNIASKSHPQPTVADGILSFTPHQLRPNALKEGAFEFRHGNWEDYGLSEWTAVDGFVDNVLTIRDLNIGKATETFTITWTSELGTEKPGAEEPAAEEPAAEDPAADTPVTNTVSHLATVGSYQLATKNSMDDSTGTGVETMVSGITGELSISGWLIKPSPDSKSGDDFQAQKESHSKETGETTLGEAIFIGKFGNDQISWTETVQAAGGAQGLVYTHTVTYTAPEK